MQDLGESGITQPMMAAYTTGLVRAAVSEALAAMGPDEWLGTVTTDGFLTTVPVDRVDQTGAVARAFVAARARITPQSPAIWEEKHREQSVSVIKTRGTVSCTPEAQKPILAKAGHKLEGKFASPAEEARVFMDLIRSRDYETRLTDQGPDQPTPAAPQRCGSHHGYTKRPRQSRLRVQTKNREPKGCRRTAHGRYRAMADDRRIRGGT